MLQIEGDRDSIQRSFNSISFKKKVKKPKVCQKTKAFLSKVRGIAQMKRNITSGYLRNRSRSQEP
jgi:hypothetical protein